MGFKVWVLGVWRPSFDLDEMNDNARNIDQNLNERHAGTRRVKAVDVEASLNQPNSFQSRKNGTRVESWQKKTCPGTLAGSRACCRVEDLLARAAVSWCRRAFFLRLCTIQKLGAVLA